MAQNNTDLLSYSSGDQKSDLSFTGQKAKFWGPQVEDSLPCFCQLLEKHPCDYIGPTDIPE